jgi:hypothetical protein
MNYNTERSRLYRTYKMTREQKLRRAQRQRDYYQQHREEQAAKSLARYYAKKNKSPA